MPFALCREPEKFSQELRRNAKRFLRYRRGLLSISATQGFLRTVYNGCGKSVHAFLYYPTWGLTGQQINLMRKSFSAIICLLSIFLVSCHQVDSNPVTGAREFCEEVSDYATINEYDKANKCLERYWDAYYKGYWNDFYITLDLKWYFDGNLLGQFCNELIEQLSNQKYGHLCTFIGSIDTDKYPLFLGLKRCLIRQLRANRLRGFYGLEKKAQQEYINRCLEHGSKKINHDIASLLYRNNLFADYYGKHIFEQYANEYRHDEMSEMVQHQIQFDLAYSFAHDDKGNLIKDEKGNLIADPKQNLNLNEGLKILLNQTGN